MSKDSKDSFVFYRDWYYAATSCDEQTQLKLYRAIMEYVFLDVEPTDPTIQLAFGIIKQRLDADLGKWEQIKEKRKEAGRRGAKKTNELRWGDKSQQMSAKSANADTCQQMSAKSAVNVNVNVDNDTNVSMLSKENTLTSVKENAADAAARAQKNYENRKKDFYDELIPFVQMYGKKMIREFYDYWTEPNISGTKFRKELEKTWSTGRRLSTWASREKITPTTPEQSQASEVETKRRSELTAEEKRRAQQLREARERLIKERQGK